MANTLSQKNLTLAANKTSLSEAALASQTLRVLNNYAGRCALCHQPIKRGAQLRFACTGVEFVIGLDCADTVNAIRRTGQTPSKKELKATTSRRLEWRRRNQDIIASMVAHLRQRKNTMPVELVEAFLYLETHGHPFTVKEGEALLDFYRHGRAPKHPLLRVLQELAKEFAGQKLPFGEFRDKVRLRAAA